MPSRDKSVKDFLYSSFSQPKIEKSDSTVAVFRKTVPIPPQKSLKISNHPLPTIDQPELNEVVCLQASSAVASRGLC